MKRKIVLLAAAGVLSSVLPLVAMGSPAQAGPNCPANTFCLYENPNYTGGRAEFRANDRDLRNNNWTGGSGGSVSNQASSMINHTNRTVNLFTNVGCSGAVYGAAPTSEDTDFRNNPGINDQVDCVTFV